jgi:hypothetical protein
MVGTPGEPAEIGKMQAALRSCLHRAASEGVSGLCGIPVPALLSLLCASALSPLIVAMAGISSASAAFVGSDILSSIGGGILSAIITETLEQAREKDVPQTAGEADGPMGLDCLSGRVSAEIDRMLTVGDANAMALRAEVVALLAVVDQEGTILRAGLEEQGGQGRAVLAEIGEMNSHIKGVVKTTAAIRSKLDDQGAGVRTLIGRSRRQSEDIGVIRKDIGFIRRDMAALARGRKASQSRAGTPSPNVTTPWRYWMVGSLLLISGVIFALAAAVLLPSHSLPSQADAGASLRSSLTDVSCTPQIGSVSPFSAAQAQDVVVKGTCLGTGGPEFSMSDMTSPTWPVCSAYQASPAACGITKWTPTSIVLNSPAGYSAPDGQGMNTDDEVKIRVKNDEGSGYCVAVDDQQGTTDCEPGCTPKINSVGKFEVAQNQTVVIKGSCFGTLGDVSAGITDDNDPFFVITDNSGGRWSGCGLNGAGGDLQVLCTVSQWSPTSVTFGGFGKNYRKNGWMLHPGDHLAVKVHNARNYSSDICNVIVGTPTDCRGKG